MKEKLEQFIKQNRKICWESEYENDEYCIGENKVRQFFESIPMQLPVGMPSETLSCELNGIKKGLGAIDSEARRQRRLAETFKVNDDSWKFHTTKAHYYEDALRVIETNKNFYIKNLASKP